MIRVLVVDDHSIVREGLKQIIGETPDLCVTAEAEGGREALQHVEQDAADIVVMDLSMPGGEGFDALVQMHRLRPRLPVLILSMHPEEHHALRVLRAGAAGYMCKDAAPDRLLEALRRIAAGGRYISPVVADLLAARAGTGAGQDLHFALSDREFQVLRLIASGKSVSAIAADLSLSVKTVSTYRARLLAKLGFKSNADLTRYAIQHRLVE